jgi:hypothetical protein
MLSRALYPREQEHNVVEAPMTSLFDDFVRADASPSAESEDYFTFLNGVDTPFWAEVRRVLDVWFSRYPGERAPALWEEFRSRRPQQQRAAFWELYLHELFLRLGYQVAVHPGLADTSHTPDFELRSGARQLYVEARVMSSEIILDEEDIRPPPWLLDAIEKIRNSNFDLQLVSIAKAGTERPKDNRSRELLMPGSTGSTRMTTPTRMSRLSRSRLCASAGGRSCSALGLVARRSAAQRPGASSRSVTWRLAGSMTWEGCAGR